MGGLGVFAGLGESRFTAGLGESDRRAGRIAVSIIGGVCIGIVVAVLVEIAALAIWSAATGRSLSAVALSIPAADGRNLSSALLLMTISAFGNSALAIGVVALSAVVFHRRVKDFLTAAAAFRWRLLLTGLVLSLAAVAPATILDGWLAGDAGPAPLLVVSPDPAGRILYAAACFLLLIPAAAAEEAIFRGWLLREVAAATRRPSVLILVTAVLFSAAHLDFSPGAFFSRALMGAGFAYMTLRLGGVELSTGAHAANNILIVLFLEPLTMKAVSAPTPLSSGGLLEDVVLVAGYILITEAVARSGVLRRWAGVSPADVSPTAMSLAAGAEGARK